MDESNQSPVNPAPVAAGVNATSELNWKPLTAKQRRVLGTLMEKSKMTPDVYPMTFSGLTTGCNQKSNREPVTNFTAEQVEGIVDELRVLGAVTIVQGSGRVTKVRHYAYNWLGLNKTEAAIMTELLLRGEQTVGELRTRASRMEPIEDLSQLNQLLQSLKDRNLVLSLTPPGRGQIVTHNLYPEWEIEQLKTKIGQGVSLEEESPTRSDSERSAVSTTKDLLASELADLKQLVIKLDERITRIERELGL